MIIHEHDKWVLKTKDGSKILGTHATKEEAEAQERAVEASKHSDDGATLGLGVRRFDVGELRKAEKLSNGWLRVEGRLTRTGIFTYLNADGTERKELRLPDEVFKPASIATFEMVPLTNEHPAPGYLDATNTKQYSVGSVSTPKADGEYLRADLLITDAECVADLEGKKKSQLSCGYLCDLDETPGVYKGERYDCVQKNIRGNHVALVTKGRAGPNASVRVDSLDIVVLPLPTVPKPSHNSEGWKMIKVKIDGVEFEVSEQVAQALSKLTVKTDDALKIIETSKARIDALSEDLKKADVALKAAQDPATLRAAIAARVSLETSARKVLDADTKFDTLNTRDIQIAVLTKLNKDFVATGKSDDYIQARFDMALEKVDASNPSLDSARQQAGTIPAGRADQRPILDSKEARKTMLTVYEDAWKQPLTKKVS